MHIHQEAHQLRDGEGRVGVVELDGEFVGERVDVRLLEQEPDAVLQRARHEEVLLLEPELLAGLAFVVGIEDLGDVLAPDLGLDRAPVLAALKGLEVELVGGDGAPESEEVRVRRLVTEHGRVVGDALDDPLGIHRTRSCPASSTLCSTVPP